MPDSDRSRGIGHLTGSREWTHFFRTAIRLFEDDMASSMGRSTCISSPISSVTEVISCLLGSQLRSLTSPNEDLFQAVPDLHLRIDVDTGS